MRRFFVLHAIAVCLHLTCAVYAFASPIGPATPFDIVVRVFDFSDRTEDAPYFSSVTEVPLKAPSIILIHGVVAVITLIFHLLLYIPMHYGVARTVWVERRAFAPRWIEYGMTCTLMTLASALSAGAQDLNLLLCIAFAGVSLQLIGCFIEQLKGLGRWVSLSLFTTGVVLDTGISWVVIWSNLSSPSPSIDLMVETAAFLFYYSLFALNNLRDALRPNACFVRTDWYYNALSLTSKLALFWLQVGDVERVFYDGPWVWIQIYGLGIALPMLLLVACACWTPPCDYDAQDRWSSGCYLRLAKLHLLKPYQLQPPMTRGKLRTTLSRRDIASRAR